MSNLDMIMYQLGKDLQNPINFGLSWLCLSLTIFLLFISIRDYIKGTGLYYDIYIETDIIANTSLIIISDYITKEDILKINTSVKNEENFSNISIKNYRSFKKFNKAIIQSIEIEIINGPDNKKLFIPLKINNPIGYTSFWDYSYEGILKQLKEYKKEVTKNE